MTGWDWRNVNLGLESQAPIVFENGTVLTLTRSWGTPPPYPNSAFWLIRADAWDGHYAKAPHAPQPFLDVTMEDSYMWIDEREHFHALFHAWAEVEVGAHAFSRDGLHWRLSDVRAFSTIVATTDGGSVRYGRRERPHLLLDELRRPTHLLTAVEYGVLGPSDFSHVHVQALVRSRVA